MNGPLSLVIEGKPQLIRVSHKLMFTKVMKVLVCTSGCLFSEIDCGDEGVKVSIKIHLSSLETRDITVLEGATMKDKLSAETSAAMLGFKHLEEVCNIKVLDFSSRVAMNLGLCKTKLYLSEAIEIVVKILNKFDMTLSKSKDLAFNVNSKEAQERFGEENDGSVAVYKHFCYFVGQCVNCFSMESSALRSRLTGLDFDVIMHNRVAKDKLKAMSSKGFSKKVFIPSKDLLEYVLCYFGLEKASYVNGPHGRFEVKAVVQFKFPYIQHLKFCGTLNVKGVAHNSVNAEENAAYNALMLIEENFKARIVDVNYAHRLEAENIQKTFANLLEGVLNVGEGVKDMWEKLSSALEERRQHCLNEADVASRTVMSEKETAAFKYNLDEMESIVQQSQEYLNECWAPFDRLKELSDELDEIKTILDIM